MLIPTKENVKTITNMRENALELLEEAESSAGPIYIFYRSEPRAVLLDLKEYEKLRDMAEDYLDSLKAIEYEKRDVSKEDWVSLKQLKKELGL